MSVLAAADVQLRNTHDRSCSLGLKRRGRVTDIKQCRSSTLKPSRSGSSSPGLHLEVTTNSAQPY